MKNYRSFPALSRALNLALPALLMFPASVRAQDAAQSARLRAAMSASAYASFNASVATAKERGLPTEPLVAKGMEGIAKGAPGERISIAVRDLADRMTRAQLILRSGAGAGRATTSVEITAVADALQRNVSEDALRKLAVDATGRATIAASSYALADLVSQGVPLAVSTEILASWRARGADPARLVEISATVERLVRQGVAPARAGTGVAAGIRLGTSLSTLTGVNLPKLP